MSNMTEIKSLIIKLIFSKTARKVVFFFLWFSLFFALCTYIRAYMKRILAQLDG